LQEDFSEKLQLQGITTLDLDHLKESITITFMIMESGLLQEVIRPELIETRITLNFQIIYSSLRVLSSRIEDTTTFIKYLKDFTDQTMDGQEL
jgi:hypothetical protein